MEKQSKRQSSVASGELLSEPGNHVYEFKQLMDCVSQASQFHWFWKVSLPRLTSIM